MDIEKELSRYEEIIADKISNDNHIIEAILNKVVVKSASLKKSKENNTSYERVCLAEVSLEDRDYKIYIDVLRIERDVFHILGDSESHCDISTYATNYKFDNKKFIKDISNVFNNFLSDNDFTISGDYVIDKLYFQIQKKIIDQMVFSIQESRLKKSA